MVRALVLSISLAASSAFAATTVDLSYEAARQQEVKLSVDEIRFLDEATPDEIATELGIEPDKSIPAENESPLYTPIGGESVNISVSIAHQALTINYPQGGFTVPVSTARRGYHTATGCFHPHRMERMWYSRKYDMSPMPHAIFFYGGFAIHGTYEERYLGRPASHGCVRVSRYSASVIYSIVQNYGLNRTRVCIF